MGADAGELTRAVLSEESGQGGGAPAAVDAICLLSWGSSMRALGPRCAGDVEDETLPDAAGTGRPSCARPQ